jgi:S1-C subfamily serine protease
LLLVNILEGKFGIPANTLKNLVDDAVKNGLIDRGIRRGELTLEMRGLGWELNVNGGFWEKL